MSERVELRGDVDVIVREGVGRVISIESVLGDRNRKIVIQPPNGPKGLPPAQIGFVDTWETSSAVLDALRAIDAGDMPDHLVSFKLEISRTATALADPDKRRVPILSLNRADLADPDFVELGFVAPGPSGVPAADDPPEPPPVEVDVAGTPPGPGDDASTPTVSDGNTWPELRPVVLGLTARRLERVAKRLRTMDLDDVEGLAEIRKLLYGTVKALGTMAELEALDGES